MVVRHKYWQPIGEPEVAALTSTVLGLCQQSCKVSILQQDTFQVQHDPNKQLSSSFKRSVKFWKTLELYYTVRASTTQKKKQKKNTHAFLARGMFQRSRCQMQEVWIRRVGLSKSPKKQKTKPTKTKRRVRGKTKRTRVEKGRETGTMPLLFHKSLGPSHRSVSEGKRHTSNLIVLTNMGFFSILNSLC